MHLIPTLALMEQVHAAPIDPYSTTTNTSSLYEVSSNCNAALSCSRPPQSLLTESAPRPSVHRINNSKNPSTYLHDRNERHYTWGAPEPPRDCSHSPTRRVNDILGQIASEVPHFNDTLQVHSTTYPHVAPESLRQQTITAGASACRRAGSHHT